MRMQQRPSWEKAKADWYATTVLWRMTSWREKTRTKFGRIETKGAAILLAVSHDKKCTAINKEKSFRVLPNVIE